jgi:hypothetical protein
MFGRDPVSRTAVGRLPLIEVGIGSVWAGRNTGAGKVAFVKFAVQH